MKEYFELLESKKARAKENGFDVPADSLHPALYDFQRFCVSRALKVGRYALFEDCGLGKTFQQIVWADTVARMTKKNVLILAPLAVVAQTIDECRKIGIPVFEWQPASSNKAGEIFIANYEQLENISDSGFIELVSGVVLDESSILKNYEGATRNLLIDVFQSTPYKLCCTATPSPNDPMELGNHADFLGVMSRAEMLAMYFVHDGGETAKWRLKGHCKSLFWQWVNTWAVMLSKPSDIGFSAEGYDLPGLNLIEKQIVTEKRNNGQLFNDKAVSATNFNQELRLTKVQRLDEVAAIVNGSDESFVIWVKQNEEGETLRKMIPGAIEVKGSDSPEYKKEKLLGFGRGDFRVIITKVKIAGFGLNWQICHNMIFASPDFSFEGIYQALRRELRFGQQNTVNAWLITTDTMENVIQSFYRKKQQHEEMQQEMQTAMKEGFENAESTARVDRKENIGSATLLLGDCVQRIAEVADESVGLSVFSPPFAELYTYSSELEDMGNSKDYREFLSAFGFLVKELFRVLWSGRNVAVHCMDLPIQKGKEGYIGLRDFSGMILSAFQDAGFIYHSRVTIWKNPVTEMQRTKALGLLHKQVKKDAAMSRVGIPDYVMVFRKPGEHLHPVRCDIPVDLWQKYASPVWYDIDYGNTLNGRGGRDERDEKHICPLQLDTIERCIHLWSNEGDTVLTPFMGIGSEVYQAVKMNRDAIGIELKPSYFELAVKNVKAAQAGKLQTALF